MKNRMPLLYLLVSAVALLVGCATPPTAIPVAYYGRQTPMSVKVTHCSPEPQMADSGQGGLLGAAFTAMVRGSSMRKAMEGVKGDAVSELLRQKLTEKMECCFDINETSTQLATEINVSQWGWFVPSTVAGMKTGSYQLQINGTVTVFDLLQQRKTVGYVTGLSQQPLGNDPTPADTQEALLKAVDDFTTKAADIILAQKPATK
jgi:hypothetical protein